MDHSNVSYMNDMHIFKWRTTDEDRRSKYIFDFREVLIFFTFFIRVFFKNNYFTVLLIEL